MMGNNSISDYLNARNNFLSFLEKNPANKKIIERWDSYPQLFQSYFLGDHIDFPIAQDTLFENFFAVLSAGSGAIFLEMLQTSGTRLSVIIKGKELDEQVQVLRKVITLGHPGNFLEQYLLYVKSTAVICIALRQAPISLAAREMLLDRIEKLKLRQYINLSVQLNRNARFFKHVPCLTRAMEEDNSIESSSLLALTSRA